MKTYRVEQLGKVKQQGVTHIYLSDKSHRTRCGLQATLPLQTATGTDGKPLSKFKLPDNALCVRCQRSYEKAALNAVSSLITLGILVIGLMYWLVTK